MKSVDLVLLAVAGMLVLATSYGGDSRIVEPSWPQARARFSDAQGCVEPVEVMRRDHMTFLFRQRDKTVHQGIRTKRHSLVGCIDCHINMDQNGNPIPINDATQFCGSCHAYASVKMDCFQCHAPTPAKTTSSRSLTRIKGGMVGRTLSATSVLLDPQALDRLLASPPDG